MNYSFGNGALEPFEVTEDLVSEVKRDFDENEILKGYKGHQIKGVGDVYTPKTIVRSILDSIGYTKDNPIEDAKIIDLSCGTGSFVYEIVLRLKGRLSSIGYDPSQPEDAREIISIIAENVHAADINTVAVWRTAQAYTHAILDEIGQLDDLESVPSLNVYNANSLLPEYSPSLGEFNFVVGNPPYMRNSEISEGDDEIYRKEFRTAKGKYDLYSLFFEKGVRILHDDGVLAFITPNRFFWTNYAEELRDLLLTETYLSAIIDLEDEPFENVRAYPCITILENRDTSFPNIQKENYLTYCRVSSEQLSEISFSISSNDVFPSKYCAQYKQSNLTGDTWRFLNQELNEIKTKIESHLKTIAELPLEIHAGVATGADDVFIIGQSDLDKVEDEVLYPIIRGRDIRRGKIEWDNKFLITPYQMDGDVIDLDDFPKTREYLMQHRGRLSNRYCVTDAGKEWFEIHDTVNLERELRRKIVTPDVTPENRFAIANNHICHNTCYSFYFEGDLLPMLGYFNSSVFEFLLKSSLPETGSNSWRQLKRDMKKLPAINPNLLDEVMYEEISDLADDEKWSAIDRVIAELLDLRDRDLQKISDYIEMA